MRAQRNQRLDRLESSSRAVKELAKVSTAAVDAYVFDGRGIQGHCVDGVHSKSGSPAVAPQQ
jgi:hypothetical protein